MKKKFRLAIAVLILTGSLVLLVWAYRPAPRETRVQPIAPSEMQLPTPSSFRFILGRVGLAEVMRRLAQLGITSVLVEGGAEISAACLEAGVDDKLVFFRRAADHRRARGASGHWRAGRRAARRCAAPAHPALVGPSGEDLMVEAHLREPSCSPA